jgi:hypothetical protein
VRVQVSAQETPEEAVTRLLFGHRLVRPADGGCTRCHAAADWQVWLNGRP